MTFGIWLVLYFKMYRAVLPPILWIERRAAGDFLTYGLDTPGNFLFFSDSRVSLLG